MLNSRQRGNGDAAVSAFRSTKDQQTLETFYDGFGGGWRWRGFGGTGLSTTTTEVTKVGNVVVDVFDAHTQKLLWRGTDSEDLSSKHGQEHSEAAKGHQQHVQALSAKVAGTDRGRVSRYLDAAVTASISVRPPFYETCALDA